MIADFRGEWGDVGRRIEALASDAPSSSAETSPSRPKPIHFIFRHRTLSTAYRRETTGSGHGINPIGAERWVVRERLPVCATSERDFARPKKPPPSLNHVRNLTPCRQPRTSSIGRSRAVPSSRRRGRSTCAEPSPPISSRQAAGVSLALIGSSPRSVNGLGLPRRTSRNAAESVRNRRSTGFADLEQPPLRRRCPWPPSRPRRSGGSRARHSDRSTARGPDPSGPTRWRAGPWCACGPRRRAGRTRRCCRS
jgi:hypothetical protein